MVDGRTIATDRQTERHGHRREGVVSGNRFSSDVENSYECSVRKAEGERVGKPPKSSMPFQHDTDIIDGGSFIGHSIHHQ